MKEVTKIPGTSFRNAANNIDENINKEPKNIDKNIVKSHKKLGKKKTTKTPGKVTNNNNFDPEKQKVAWSTGRQHKG